MTPNEIYHEALQPSEATTNTEDAALRKQEDFIASLPGWRGSSVTQEFIAKLMARRQQLIQTAMTLSLTAVNENGILLRTLLCEAAAITNVIKLTEEGTY